MKHVYISSLIILLTMSAGLFAGCTTQATQPATSGITWLTDYETALQKAKTDNKPMLLDFYTDWCGWCKKMDQTTYQQQSIVDLSKRFIMVKVNGDKRSDLVTTFKISGYPSTVFLGPDGKHLSTAVGYQQTKPMSEKMEQILKFLAQKK